MQYKCGVCGNTTDNTSLIAREMMLGIKEDFEYFQCSNCGCLQLKDIPANMGRYYPKEDYYSLKKENIKKLKPVKKYIKGLRANWNFSSKKNLLGGFINLFYKPKPIFGWLKCGGVELTSSILDVGCGSGGLLLKLREEGFLNNRLVGIDPFIQEDINYSNGVTILKKTLSEIDEKFDFIMMHHSFEHMKNPQEVMKSLSRVLTDRGVALIRVPLASSHAYRKYGNCWVQLDAPRHLYLHTVRSIEILAKNANLTIPDIKYDSGDFQFYGSELYQRGISLKDTEGDAKAFFSNKVIRSFQKEADRLNQIGDGDQAGFYLRKE